MAATGGWSNFADSVETEVELTAGRRPLRVEFAGGEVNLGRMEFRYLRDLPAGRPQADAGSTVFVRSPATEAQLDGSASSVADGATASYAWEQLYGPSNALISDPTLQQPMLSGLVDGLYRFRLNISDGLYSDSAEVDVVVSPLQEFPPQVSLVQPLSDISESLGTPVQLSASATDLDGQVAYVSFYVGDLRIGTAWQAPFSMEWIAPAQGDYLVTAVATDDSGLRSKSEPVLITMGAPAPCSGTVPSGDFSFAFTEDESGAHYLTFHPSRAGMGSPTCILYYSTTGSQPFGGHLVTPGQPYRLNADSGQTVYFYYTYSHPDGGERNSSGAIANRTLGICGEPAERSLAEWVATWQQAYFSEETLADAAAEERTWGLSADPDGDGWSNRVEFISGTDPLQPSPAPMYMEVSAGTSSFVHTRRKHLPQGCYTVEYSNDLAEWSSDGLQSSVIEDDSGRQVVRVTDAGSALVFFRIVVAE
jgi:hypothetical protein